MRIRASVLGLALVGVALSGCLDVAPSGPPFPGYAGALSQSRGRDGKTVLVTGDSLALSAGSALQGVLTSSGRCASVVNAAVAGTSLGDWLPRPDALYPIDQAIARYHPDVVVMEHVGNQGLVCPYCFGPIWTDPNYVADAGALATQISNAGHTAGVPLVWAVPPIAAFSCDFGALSAARFVEWKDWIAANAQPLTGNPPADWRRPFGGESYSSAFDFGPGVGVQTVRDFDCTHFKPYGSAVAASATAIAIQGFWHQPTSPSAPTPSTTATVTTAPAPPTSTLMTPGA